MAEATTNASQPGSKAAAALIDPEDRAAVRRVAMRLAGPSLTEMLLINLAQMLNMILVGRLGAVAVATVGLTSQPFMLMQVLFMAMNTGTTILVSRAFGAGRIDEANRAAGQAVMLNALMSIAVIAAAYSCAEPLLRLMGADDEIVDYGLNYAKILFATIGFSSISTVLASILRGSGDTRTPMKISIVSNLLAVTLGFVLIYGHLGLPEMGIAGAAVATFVSQALSLVCHAVIMLSGKSAVQVKAAGLLRLDREILLRVLKVGLPACAEQLILRAGIAVFVKISAGLGTVALAANQLATSVLGLSFMPGFAFAIAASTLVGQALGAGKPELAVSYVKQIRRFSLAVGGVMGAVFILLPQPILMLYTSDPEVIREGALALRIVGMIQLAQASQFVLGGALRGAGDTRYQLYSTFIGVWGVRVVLAWLFVNVLQWGMAGLWTAVALDQFLRSLLIARRYRQGGWQRIQV